MRLRAPISGRRVDGEPRLGDKIRFSQARVNAPRDATDIEVPRVVGLAREDAVRLLRLQHFQPRPPSRGARVTAQRPTPGTRIRWDGKGAVSTVRLSLTSAR